MVTSRRQKSGIFVTSLLGSYAVFAGEMTSSCKIAAMVLKNMKASQGNVWPVDI
jgi:hypothetical protein